MIISASYRSDIPAFHAFWFEAALDRGEVLVQNPYSSRKIRVDLSPGAVDGYVFWTRNPRPFRRALERLAGRGAPFVMQMTAIGYPRALDPCVPGLGDAIGQIRDLSERWGKATVVWRYDPILVTPETEIAWHRENFARIARELTGFIDEVVVSFAQIYDKTQRNLKRAAIDWRDPGDEEKAELALNLSTLAKAQGMTLTLCAQPDVALASGLPGARCIDAGRLLRVAGRSIEAVQPKRPNRPGCQCDQARDIGRYDSCAHGCRYCYAVSDHDRVAAMLKERIEST